MFWNLAFESTDSRGATATAEYNALQRMGIGEFYDLLANSQRYNTARKRASKGGFADVDEWG
jgi:hypothetical protein